MAYEGGIWLETKFGVENTETVNKYEYRMPTMFCVWSCSKHSVSFAEMDASA